MESRTVLFAFALTLFAGLSTGIGSLIALFAKKIEGKFFSVSLGFSAGVMIYVSMIEIFSKAKEALSGTLGKAAGHWAAAGSFFAGIFIVAAIDRLVPVGENPHEIHNITGMETKLEVSGNKKLMRMGILTAAAIAVHNFPEGIATFMSALKSPALGIAISVAIALHNIPEGIAVSAPVYFATGDRKKAFKVSFLTGLSEPAGALLGYLVFYKYFNDVIFGIIFGVVAGFMVYISLDELLPAAIEYGDAHISIYALIAGMIVMSVSLLIFMQ